MTAPDDDPLWLNSPHKRLAFRVACYGVYVGLFALLFGWLIGGAKAYLLGAGVGLFSLLMARDWLVEALLAPVRALRRAALRPLESRHHDFAGVALLVHDDGHGPWLHEAGLRRLLGLQRDPPDAFRARFAGHWREARELGAPRPGLWIAASAVHAHLASAPGRMDPKRLKLRTYIDRDILQPAARRRQRGG